MTTPASRRGVTVLIVNYNGWRDTSECLSSLYHSDYPEMRVLVLDNASPDDSVARLEQWITDSASRFTRHIAPEIVRLEANLGFAGANNVGLRRMLADSAAGYAWLLNGDTIVASDALSRMVALADNDPMIGMVGAKILRYGAPEVVEAAGGGTVQTWSGMARNALTNTPRSRQSPQSPRLDYVAGTSLLVSRDVVERVGLMDERYFLYAEDADWCIQARRRGFRLAYCAEAEVWHKGGGSTVHRSALHDYHTLRSLLLFVFKLRPAFLPAALLYSVWRFAVPKIVRGQWQRLRAVLRAYRDFARQPGGAKSYQNRGDAVSLSDTLRTS